MNDRCPDCEHARSEHDSWLDGCTEAGCPCERLFIMPEPETAR